MAIAQLKISQEPQEASSQEALSIFEIALFDDSAMKKSPGLLRGGGGYENVIALWRAHIGSDRFNELHSGMYVLACFWTAGMDDAQRGRIAPEILNRLVMPPKFEKQFTSRDTCWFMMRDIINSNLPPAKVRLDFDPTSPRQLDWSITSDSSDVTGRVYSQALVEILNFQRDKLLNYSLCEQCGKPFQHKSKRAIYCSNSCRVAAARERKK